MRLAIYLNDHLAGATAGRELARRAARSNESTDYGPALAELANDIEQDRRTLLRVMDTLGIRADPVKVAAGWAGEKVGRLKLNGQLRGYSPLSRLIELEALTLGVTGKLSMWRALEQIHRPELAGFELRDLQQRAESQLARLEDCRRRAVTAAL
jgi:hypothetical protein